MTRDLLVATCAATVLCLSSGAFGSGAASAQQISVPGRPTLVPGRTVSVPAAGKGPWIFLADLEPERIYRLELVAEAHQVELEVVDPEGSSSLRIVSLMGFGWADVVVWSGGDGGRYRIETRAAQPGSEPGRLILRLDVLPTASDAARLRSERALMLTRARAALAVETSESRKVAADLARSVLGGGEGRLSTAESVAALVVLAEAVDEARSSLKHLGEAVELVHQQGDLTAQASLHNAMGVVGLRLGNIEAAGSSFERARELWTGLQSRTGALVAEGNLCLIQMRSGDWPEAGACYQRVVDRATQIGDLMLEARFLVSAGGAAANLGLPDQAIASYERSLRLATEIGDRLGEAQVRNNLGALHRRLGEPGVALEHYRRALERFEQLGDLYWQARTINNLGYAYLCLGEPERASSSFLQALPLRRAVGDRSGEATTLRNLARAELLLDEPGRAVQKAERALLLSRAMKSRRSEAGALLLLGMARARHTGPASALEDLESALTIRKALGDRVGQAEVQLELGEALIGMRRPEQARRSLGQAREIFDLVGDAAGRTRACYLLARANDLLGRLPEALHQVDLALREAESLRARIPSPMQRATFLDAHREAYELKIDLLIRLSGVEPGAELVPQALITSERARARMLLDLLDLTNGGPLPQLPKVDPSLQERLRSARRQLDAAAQQQLTAAGCGAGSAVVAEARNRVLEALTRVEMLDNEVRRLSPRWAALNHQQPLDAAQMQAQIDADTVLLEYALGRERSYVWSVTGEAIEVVELPGRELIEDAARRAFERLASYDLSGRANRLDAACELSEMVLGPVEDVLGHGRLVVVADGALHLIPFATLPRPGSTCDRAASARLLIDDHEVVHLPSLTALVHQRRLGAGLTRPGADRVGDAGDRSAEGPGLKVVAALGDPILEPDDPRLGGGDRPEMVSGSGADDRAVPVSSIVDDRRPRLQRLVGSGDEARRIAAMAGPDRSLLALGAQARRELLLDPAIGEYRMLHLASHGVIDPITPELSGVMLSRFDSYGRPINGLVRLHDLLGLRLRSELVVLSGCHTGLGRQLRGEGLVGLARGFMYAGAPRVVSSLWQVRDDTAAEIMVTFYDLVLNHDVAPAAALRSAQQAARQTRGAEAPFFWGAFVFLGDWR